MIHAAHVLCITALQQYKTIKYVRACTLLQESEKARLNAHSYADACLTRMTAKAYRLECNGRDMSKA